MMMEKIYLYQKALAKLFDYAICFLGLAFAALLTPFAEDGILYLSLLAAIPFLWILPEALLLSTLGSTPGCALFGISPERNQAKLSWKEALLVSLFLGKRIGVQWIRCNKSLPNFISRIAIGCLVIFGAVFVKAILEFPKEFQRQVPFKSWVHYTSSEGDFTADFPSKPMVEQKQLEIPQANRTLDYQEVKADHSDQVTYSVSALELPKKWSFFGSNTVLKGALSVLVDNLPGAKLVNKKLTKHGEHPAIDFHIHEHATDTKGRLVLVGSKLFKIEYTQPTDQESSEKGSAFIDSFKPL